MIEGDLFPHARIAPDMRNCWMWTISENAAEDLQTHTNHLSRPLQNRAELECNWNCADVVNFGAEVRLTIEIH